ncbi:MAG: DegV family EDD domain-containing protein, partial [Clostridia bacterium]|nr:DegV family EDD domain-containing protein [Clostridia bacterium]
LLGLIIVREIGEMYLAGKTAEEIVEWADANVLNYAMYLYADDLKFFAKSGRISNFSAIMGSLIGLHPIIHLSKDGKMVSLCKCRGKKGSLAKIMEIIEETHDNICENKVIVGHTGDAATAEYFAEKIKEKFGVKDIEMVVVNPTVGGHCGPGCVGVALRVKHRS